MQAHVQRRRARHLYRRESQLADATPKPQYEVTLQKYTESGTRCDLEIGPEQSIVREYLA